MSATQSGPPPENVVGGTLLALLAVPVGVVVLALISAIGFVASIVGFLVAYCAVWLYHRGSGGRISRTGAWIVTAIVLGTLLLGVWVTLVLDAVGGIGHLDRIGTDNFWPRFNAVLPALINADLLFIVLILVFGAVGAFRTLRRAFLITRVTGPGPAGTPSSPAATVYRNDVDAPPTGSADEKTLPPTIGG